jgi:hypothetical protein
MKNGFNTRLTTRLFNVFKKEKPKTKLEYQQIANKVLEEMSKDFEKHCEGFRK